MLKRRMLVLAAIVLTSSTQAHAATDAAAGKEKASICGPCHGVNGVSVRRGIPSLAGQQDQYIQRQLVLFRSGRRSNPTMGPLAANLSDEDVRNLGAYFASLPYTVKPATEAPNAELAANGKVIAGRHHCASCHMDTYRGKRAAAAIADQREDYLVKAMTDYRSASRPGTIGAPMTKVAAGLNDEQIAAVSHYIATLGSPHK